MRSSASISILASMTHTGIFEINQPDRGKVVTAHDEILKLQFSVFATCLFVQSQYVLHNFDSVEADLLIKHYAFDNQRQIYMRRLLTSKASVDVPNTHEVSRP
jgi:hypothetical protein